MSGDYYLPKNREEGMRLNEAYRKRHVAQLEQQHVRVIGMTRGIPTRYLLKPTDEPITVLADPSDSPDPRPAAGSPQWLGGQVWRSTDNRVFMVTYRAREFGAVGLTGYDYRSDSQRVMTGATFIAQSIEAAYRDGKLLGGPS